MDETELPEKHAKEPEYPVPPAEAGFQLWAACVAFCVWWWVVSRVPVWTACPSLLHFEIKEAPSRLLLLLLSAKHKESNPDHRVGSACSGARPIPTFRWTGSHAEKQRCGISQQARTQPGLGGGGGTVCRDGAGLVSFLAPLKLTCLLNIFS